MSAEQRLLTLLFEEGRVLENLKFFPGDECTSADDLFGAAYEAIRMTLDGNSVSAIPSCGAPVVAIGDAISRF